MLRHVELLLEGLHLLVMVLLEAVAAIIVVVWVSGFGGDGTTGATEDCFVDATATTAFVMMLEQWLLKGVVLGSYLNFRASFGWYLNFRVSLGGLPF